MYSAYGLLTPDTDFNLSVARERLQKRFPDATVSLDSGVLTLAGRNWDFQLRVNQGDLSAEQQVMAEQLGGADANPEVAACTQRVELWSNTNDPFLEHLADFQAVLEVLQSFRGLIVIDPNVPAFM